MVDHVAVAGICYLGAQLNLVSVAVGSFSLFLEALLGNPAWSLLGDIVLLVCGCGGSGRGFVATAGIQILFATQLGFQWPGILTSQQ